MKTAVAVAALAWAAAFFARRHWAIPPAPAWPGLAGRRRAERRLLSVLPDVLDRLSADLRGGGSVLAALRHAAAGAGPLGSDLARIVDRVVAGAGISESIAAWSQQRPLPPVQVVAGALEVAATSGGRAAVALEGLAAGLRDRRDIQEEVLALSSQARLSAAVVGLAPLGSLGVSLLVDGRVVSVLLGTAPGRVCLAAGLGLQVVAGLWMGRILRVPA
jgi:tight adherence protein B